MKVDISEEVEKLIKENLSVNLLIEDGLFCVELRWCGTYFSDDTISLEILKNE